MLEPLLEAADTGLQRLSLAAYKRAKEEGWSHPQGLLDRWVRGNHVVPNVIDGILHLRFREKAPKRIRREPPPHPPALFDVN
jgi:hypothetical protein